MGFQFVGKGKEPVYLADDFALFFEGRKRKNYIV